MAPSGSSTRSRPDSGSWCLRRRGLDDPRSGQRAAHRADGDRGLPRRGVRTVLGALEAGVHRRGRQPVRCARPGTASGCGPARGCGGPSGARATGGSCDPLASTTSSGRCCVWVTRPGARSRSGAALAARRSALWPSCSRSATNRPRPITSSGSSARSGASGPRRRSRTLSRPRGRRLLGRGRAGADGVELPERAEELAHPLGPEYLFPAVFDLGCAVLDDLGEPQSLY
jgi:hypothetical protein